MAFTLRQETASGFTTKGSALSYAEGDNNFIGLYGRDELRLPLSGGTLTGALTISSGNFNVASGQILSGGTDIATLWGGGGATSLNDLSDAKADNFDLALGFEAGNDMDLSADNTYNVYVGGKSGYDSDSDTTQNVGVGWRALENSEAGSYQVAVGFEALNQGTTGTNKNTALGWRALKGSTGGQENVAVGYGVFSLAGTGGDYNVSVGANAHTNAHSNAGDVAIGYNAGFYGRDDYSVAVGYQAGYGNSAQTAGAQNVYLGAESGYKSKASTGNIGVGYKSLYDLNDGEYNIGLGWSALENITDCDNNITIGKSAGDNITIGSDNIIIGNTVDASAADVDNELNIGNQIIGSMDSSDQYTKFVGQTYGELYTQADGVTITPDFTNGNVQTVELGGNRAIANPDNIKVGATYMIILKQDATGSRTVTWGTNYKFPGGTAPTLTTTGDQADVITLIAYSASVLMCSSTLNFATS